MVRGGRGEKCLHGVMEPSLLRVVSQCSGVRGALTVFFFFFPWQAEGFRGVRIRAG